MLVSVIKPTVASLTFQGNKIKKKLHQISYMHPRSIYLTCFFVFFNRGPPILTELGYLVTKSTINIFAHIKCSQRTYYPQEQTDHPSFQYFRLDFFIFLCCCSLQI